MSATLAQLLQGKSVVEIFNTLLGVYQANGFPVQSWQPGGVERTRLMAFATGLEDISANYIPGVTAGGFLDYAPDTGWMPLLAQQLYNLDQQQAVNTVGNITLTAATGSGPYTFTGGQLIAVFAATGHRYLNTGPGTLTLSGALVVPFRAEFPGSTYSDPSNSGALSLVTPLPGVTLTNPAGTYSPVSEVGGGTGSLTLAGSPVGPHQVIVLITSSGQSGAATWSTSLDGAPYVDHGAAASVTNLGGVGINITLVNGGSGTSFLLNDTFTFGTPGSWITTQGANTETDALLAQACRARWSSLGNVAVSNLYYILATRTPSVGAQVTQVEVVPDAVVNNQVNVIIAGPLGALPGAVVTAVQTYINPRAGQGDRVVVQSPTPLSVTLAGAVTCSASQLVAAQDAIQTAMTNYVNGVGINGTVRLSAVIELVMQVAGVVDFSGVTINGAAANLVMGTSTSFIVADLQPLTFTYVTL